MPAQPLSARERTACARDVVGAFVDAFDRGDARALETFFSLDRGVRPFTWFVTPTTPAYGPSRADVPRYLTAARAAGERWRVVRVAAGPGPSWHGGVDFEMEIERALPERTTVHIGKGALDCVARTIFVFALGDAIEPRQGTAH